MQTRILKSISGRAPWLALASALLLTGCASQQPAAPDTRAADEAAIRKADDEWAKAGQTHSVDAWMAFYTSDAVLLPPNEPIADTPEKVRKSIGGLLGLPGLDIKWQAAKVEVARSGDLAYLYGTYQMTFDGGKGKKISDNGKILEIWEKQPDGRWKCSVDTYSSDLPAPPPPAK